MRGLLIFSVGQQLRRIWVIRHDDQSSVDTEHLRVFEAFKVLSHYVLSFFTDCPPRKKSLIFSDLKNCLDVDRSCYDLPHALLSQQVRQTAPSACSFSLQD